jgi:hypothetical protein
MSIPELKFSEGSLQKKVWDVLKDMNWHCRGCEYKHVGSDQLAGGGGIQGLERGNKSRPGVVIESAKYDCTACGKRTSHDRWTGEIQSAVTTSGINRQTQERIFRLLKYTDVVEQRVRPEHELIIDHRFPMNRWDDHEPKNSDLADEVLVQKFQLLKKEANGNHNSLKTRACETCVKTHKRGKPFGINFFYHGDENWAPEAEKGYEAEDGCVGCGWYDFDTWRAELNKTLLEARPKKVDVVRESPRLYRQTERPD